MGDVGGRGLMYKMLAALCGAALVGTAISLPGNAQQPPRWADRESATPGVQLTLQEATRAPYNGVTRVIYRLALAGAPEDRTYQLFFVLPGEATAYRMGWRPNAEAAAVILCHQPSIECPALRPAEINGKTFGVYGYPKGKAVRLMVASADQSVKAFAEVFPFPLEARDGPCHLWAELIPDSQGRSFAFHGDGFPPGAKVVMSSRSGGEIQNRTINASANGSLPPTIISPAVAGQTSGVASLTAIGPACLPAVAYQWGSPALAEQ
jgi:hypothetical protein